VLYVFTWKMPTLSWGRSIMVAKTEINAAKVINSIKALVKHSLSIL
jgi:hypothetical protein